MSNSNLVNTYIMSPNHSGKRTQPISRLTVHCVVGQLTSEQICNIFVKKSRKASCNYCIGKDGDIGLCVDECNRSWCTSSSVNDQRAITIEVASDKAHPYAFNNKAYSKLVELTIDIMKRNNKNKLIFINDKNKSLKYEPKENELMLTYHKWYANKACPGQWFIDKTPEFVNTINSYFNNEIPIKKQEIYIVKKGDTLGKIAKKYGTTYIKLAQYNKIANPNIIRVGQKIIIP